MAAQPAPRDAIRESSPGPRVPASTARAEALAARAQAVGRTTSRDEVPAGLAPQAPPPSPTKPMAAMAAPAATHAEGPRPRATVKNFDAVQPPVTDDQPAVAGAGKALEVLRDVNERVAAQLDLARLPLERLSDEALWQRTEAAVVDLLEQLEADGALPAGLDQDAMVKDALGELLGLGALDDLLADDEVGEIMVNRSDRILIERGGRVSAAPKVFSSEAALRQVVDRLLASSGHRLDEATPLCDARLPGGTRVIAAQPPIAPRGLTVTIRKPPKAVMGLDELVRGGSLSPQMAAFLGTCLAARRNVIVCGGAGSGKTAFVGALAGLARPDERVVSIEEVGELALPHDHWIALEARPGAASLVDVLRSALRMRPDRLVIGEVRGVEALEVLSAFAAAEGGLAAVAGDGPAAALARLESLARLAAPEASARGLRELAAHAAHVVVHVARYSDGVRRIASISEVTGVQGEGYAVRDLFNFQMQGHGPDGLRGRFAGAGVVPRFYGELEARGEKADPAVFR
jgi:pilus assembly protein CpaF